MVQEGIGEKLSRPEGPSFFDIIYKRTTEAILPYKESLQEQVDEDKLSDLDAEKRKLLKDHMSQLDILSEILERVKQGKPFTPVIRDAKLLEGENDLRQTFTARLAPKDERIPIDPNNPQIQLSLHSNISALEPESISEAFYALGMRLQPPEVLQRAFGQSTEQLVEINTVAVYRDPDKRIRWMSQGGVTFRWRKDEDSARVGGFVYVGMKPHILLLAKRIPLNDFAVMQATIVRLSGYKSKKGI